MTFSVTRERDMIIVQVTSGGVTVKAAEYRTHMLGFWHELGKHVIEDTEDRAKAGYERFHASFDDTLRPVPWEALRREDQEHWIAAFTE